MGPSDDLVPPKDLDLERAALGVMLTYHERAVEGVELLRETDFYSFDHRVVLAAITKLVRAEKQVDFPVVKGALSRAKKLDDAGGAAYLLKLTDGVPQPKHLRTYAQQLRALSIRREIMRAGTDLASMACDTDEDAGELVQKAERRLAAAQQSGTESGFYSTKSLLDPFMADLEARQETRGMGVTTGVATLDDLTNGWQPGELVLLAARPSIGKSALMLAMARSAAESGKAALVFSLEMRKEVCQYRLISAMSGVTNYRLKRADMREQDWRRVSAAMNALGELPIYIDDSTGLTAQEVRGRVRRFESEHERKVDLVMLDYVGLMKASALTQRENRAEQVRDISQRLKLAARELGLPFVVLCQLNRESEKRQSSRPQISDLRDSGALEQDADIIMLLHQEDRQQSFADTRLKMYVDKNRDNPTGAVDLVFDKTTQHVFELPSAESDRKRA